MSSTLSTHIQENITILTRTRAMELHNHTNRADYAEFYQPKGFRLRRANRADRAGFYQPKGFGAWHADHNFFPQQT